MMKKLIYLFLFSVFVIISCMFINPVSNGSASLSGSYSKELKKVTVRDENSERTDYIDENGTITVANDLGYATVITTKTDNRLLESYFDDHGNPAILLTGNSAVMREYNEEGYNVRVIYLDKDGKPITNRNGYAVESREYNQKGQMTVVRYYDETGNPACFIAFGYGKYIDYDEEGNPSRVVYIDASDVPMMTQEGYSIVNRTFYHTKGPENGKTEYEFYYDTKGQPVRLPLGQYGLHKEYDEFGRENCLTYLGADGEPMVISKGFATIRKTFLRNGQVENEQYYNQSGEPCALADGQYGFRNKDGKKVYLDKNGNEQRSLKSLLYDQSWLVIVIAVTAMILSVLTDQRANCVFLVLCILTIVYLTLVSRGSLSERPRIRIFWSYLRMIFDKEIRASVLKNIWLFIPLGTILYKLCPYKKVLLIPVLVSIMIEMIQLLTGTGYCDLDDIISNGIGGLIGFENAEIMTDFKNYLGNKKERSIQQGG